jgi:glyoxylase-like metal-dependent hydrolase (beta-lactamase superfamily II)
MTRLITIDADYITKGLACAYLRIESGEAAFIETATTHSTPQLLAALEREGLSPEDVRYVIVTHVHLDHAGGASALARACPHATVLAHPRAARHLINPAKLLASARAVYGDAVFESLYGEIEPIDASRVTALEDEAQVSLGTATLRFLHTRGHANHHFVVHDPSRDTAYTGDTFGLAYPRLQREGRFAYPSTSPTDFDRAAAHESIDRILALGTRTVCLTHFGEVDELPLMASQLHRWLEMSGSIMEGMSSIEDAELEPTIRKELEREMNEALAARGLVPDANDRQILEVDLTLNAQGLAHAVRQERTKG